MAVPRKYNAERMRLYQQRFRADPANAEKIFARRMSAAAINSGKLIPLPCENCGAKKTDGHHEDYSKPLELKWLCRKCHKAVHHKTHCKHGHALTADNVLYEKRVCKICQQARMREYKLRHRTPPVRINLDEKSHCVRGHEVSTNKVMRKDGKNICRACWRISHVNWLNANRPIVTIPLLCVFVVPAVIALSMIVFPPVTW